MNINSFSLSKISNLFGRDGVDQNAFCVPCVQEPLGRSLSMKGSFRDRNFSSLAFNFEEPFDLRTLKIFMDEALRLSSEQMRQVSLDHDYQNNYVDDISSIYRMKGIIRIKDVENLYILQSVYDVYDIQISDYVGKSSHIVVIGLNLNETKLRNGFRSCLFPQTVDCIKNDVHVKR